MTERLVSASIYSPSELFNFISLYEILYGRTPTSLTDIKTQSQSITTPTFYHFADYLDLFQDRMHNIRNIVADHHNQTVEKKRNQTHGSKSQSFHDFMKESLSIAVSLKKLKWLDIEYLLSYVKLHYVGPLDKYSNYDELLYAISTIAGVVTD